MKSSIWCYLFRGLVLTLSCPWIADAAVPEIHRLTRRYDVGVRIHRAEITAADGRVIRREEKNRLDTLADPYGVFKLILSGAAYTRGRNCHDFAWGPFMSQGPDQAFVEPESYVMEDENTRLDPNTVVLPEEVSANWRDNPVLPSMANVLTSLPNDGTDFTDYIFIQSDFDQVLSIYPSIFGSQYPIGLPVCPLNHLTTEEPPHSAILVGKIQTDENRVAGIYRSKWGKLGIFEHRWGPGFIDPAYIKALTYPDSKKQPVPIPATTLKVFGPTGTPFGGGAWTMVHSAWGTGSPPQTIWPQGP